MDNIIGDSPWARQMRADIVRIAPHSCSVLVIGPSGTGKELIARAIHGHSGRGDKPLVVIDCAAMGGTLFSSHVFGHTRGAFTGADHSAMGCFRVADGGTVFLDEIGELEPECQAKLLRVLQQRTVTPLGSSEEIPIDVRIIAATNRNLPEMVSQGQFREDLYYRLNVVSLATIPLKERREDISVLVRHILARLASRADAPLEPLPEACLRCIRAADWPGNVRELENWLERFTLLGGEAGVSSECSPGLAPSVASPARQESAPEPSTPPGAEALRSAPRINPAHGASAESGWPTLATVEREHIRHTLDEAGGNVSHAARLLDISRYQLLRRLKELGLEKPAAHRPLRPR